MKIMQEYSVKAVLDASDAGFSSKMRSAKKAIDELDASGNRASVSIAKIAAGQGAFTVVSKAASAVTRHLDKAIDRFDTMNRFPRVMEGIGFSSEKADASVQKLSDGIRGLPTSLDGIVGSTQKIALLTKDLDKATDTSLALNNAFLASGAAAADAERGLVQYTQMLSKGTVDIQSWRTLQESMGVALTEIAESFGFAGQAAQNDLYKALQDGTITFSQMNDKLIELDTRVGGFAERARTASEGIKTSFTNIGTSVVRGVEGVIRTVDTSLSESGLPDFNETLGMAKEGVDEFFSVAQEGAGMLVSFVAPAFKLVGDNIDVITTVLGIGTAGFVAYKSAMAIQSVSQKFNGELALAKVRIEAVAQADVLAAKASELSAKATEVRAKAARMAAYAEKSHIQTVLLSNEALKAKTVAEGFEKEASKKRAAAEKIAAKAVLVQKEADRQAANATKRKTSEEKKSVKIQKLQADASKKSAEASLLNAEAKKLEAKASAAHANAEKLEAEAQKNSILAERADTMASQMNTKAEVADTAAIKANTEANAANSISIGAKTVLLGALAKAEGVATVASKALMAAWAANPIGLAIGAVTGLVAVLGALSVASDKLNAEEREAAAAKKEHREETNNLVDALKEEHKAREEELEGVEAEAQGKRELLDKISALSKKENKSSRDKAELKGYIDALNTSMKGLNLTYDEQTDSLSKEVDAIYAVIDAQEQVQKASKAQEKYAEVLSDLEKVEADIAKYEKEKQDIMAENARRISNETELMRANNAATAEQSKQILALKEQREDLLADEAKYKDALTQSNLEQAEAVANNVASQIVSLDNLSEAQESTMDRILGIYGTMTSGLSDLSKKIEMDSELTWNSVKQNQQDALASTQEFASLYAQLIDAGVSESYLNAIGATGPEALPLLQGMMQSGVDEVLAYQGEWETAYDSIGTAFTDSLEMDDSVRTAVNDFISGESGVYGALQQAVDAADFDALAVDAVAGYAKGFENTTEATEAATNMATDTQEAVQKANDSHSPSRKYEGFAVDAMDGYGLGFKNRTAVIIGIVESTMNRISSAALRHANMLQNRLRESGQWAAIGLANGLDDGSHYAVAAAARLANRVSDTINAELKVGSPAKVPRESGNWAAIGLALGLMDYLRKVEKASETLSRAAIPTIPTAERIAHTNRGVFSYDYEVSGDSFGGNYTIIVPVEIDGREVARVTAPYTQEELARIERMSSRKRGYR